MLGQTIGEMPHINNLIKSGNLETEGLDRIKKGPAILVGAHMGNWEFLLRVGDLAGRRAGYVFRPINNWILNKIQIYRNKDANADFYRKGRLAAIGMASKIKNGEVIGLTGDQLLREGIMVPFFGIKTPTPQAAAIMALKWNVPIYMVRVERFKGIKFKLIVEDKLNFPKNLDNYIETITNLNNFKRDKWTLQENLFGSDFEIINQMTDTMQLLKNLCDTHNIELVIAVYPHMSQIFHSDLESKQVKIWGKFSKKNNINFINFFPKFINKDNSKEERIKIIKKYFFPFDMHYNKEGNKLIAEYFLKTFY